MNPRQKLFVGEYLVDKNGTEAARRAGYRGSDVALATQAGRLLRKAEIKEAVEKGIELQRQAAERRATAKMITREEWLERLRAIAFANITDAFQPNENGKMTMTIEQLKKSPFGALIRKLKVLPGGKVEFDIHPVLGAMELLGKSQGWVKEQVEHSGAIGTSHQPLTKDDFKEVFRDPELAALLDQVAKKTNEAGPQPVKGENRE